jgi:hypothetical protein
VLLLEQVERQAVADRQAELAVAIAERWEDYAPISIGERLAAFEAALNADPSDSDEARVEAQIQRLRGVA